MTSLTNPVRRQTLGTLDGSFGQDRNRCLVVTLERGDLISLRPAKTRRAESISLFDLYRIAIRTRVNRELLEKNRAKIAKNKERKAMAAWKRSVKRGKLA